jgi:hypothetical protein
LSLERIVEMGGLEIMAFGQREGSAQPGVNPSLGGDNVDLKALPSGELYEKIALLRHDLGIAYASPENAFVNDGDQRRRLGAGQQ